MNDPKTPQKALKTREAVFAGSWYEGTEAGLRKQVDRFLDKAKTVVPDGPVRALISPHAGYTYSGSTAAVGYKTLRGAQVKRVIVLAPSHRYPLMGASIADVTHYSTPLGLIPLDREACDKILENELFSSVPAAHRAEHSLEIQLPFLQRVLEKGFTMIPIVVGETPPDQFEEMTSVLLPYWDENTIIVASSDFTHFGHSFGYVPFEDNVAQNLSKLDHGAANRIVDLDRKGFDKYVAETGATICGRKPISLLLGLADKKGVSASELFYTTSGEITGDYSHTVSYMSIAMTGGTFGESYLDNGCLLSEEEKQTLLRLARDTLKCWLETGRKKPDLSAYDITDRLKSDFGAFVTLKKKGDLRGCIGYLVARGPLFEAVMNNTVNAAAHDVRFPPVALKEEPDIRIEISALSPLVRVKDIKEIVVGRDGLIITKGLNRGTLLPQVATEYGWDRITFLEHTCHKAGLPKNAYKEPDVVIERYSAQVFGEHASPAKE